MKRRRKKKSERETPLISDQPPTEDPIRAIVESVPEVHEETPDDEGGFDRAKAAADGFDADGEPTEVPPVEPERLGVDELIGMIEMLFALSTEGAAMQLGIPVTPEIDALGRMQEWEKKIFRILGPRTLANLDKLDAFLQKFGAVFFGGAVLFGIVARVRILKAYARAMKAERERTAGHGTNSTPPAQP